MKKAALVATATLVVALMVAVLAGCGGSTPTSYTGSVHPGGWGSTPKGVTLPAPLLQAVPTALMYDSVTLSTVPAHPYAQAGYTSGLYPTYDPMRAAWPTSHTVSIAITARNHADCLDVEPGDAVPSQAGPWAKADTAAGFPKPCEYFDLSEKAAVEASDRAVLGPNWRSMIFEWLAWYTKRPGLVQGADAVQYDDTCLGRNLDCSTASLPFLTIAQPPYVAPTPKPRPKPTPKPKPTPRPRPSKAQVCKALNARSRWFATQLKQHPKVKTARRQGALASTRRAERRVGCVVK